MRKSPAAPNSLALLGLGGMEGVMEGQWPLPQGTMVVTATQTAKVFVPEFQKGTGKEAPAQSREQLPEARRAEMLCEACLLKEKM